MSRDKRISPRHYDGKDPEIPDRRTNQQSPADEEAVRAALELVDCIVDTIEEKVGESAKRKAPEFFESIDEKAKSIGETIERTRRATDNQINALKGMLAGVRKWVHNDD